MITERERTIRAFAKLACVAGGAMLFVGAAIVVAFAPIWG